MKEVIYILLFVLLALNISPAQTVGDIQDEPVKIEAQPTKGFAYPYYLYVPKAMREVGARKQTQTILVIPNNAGKTDDDFAVHEADAKRKIGQNKTMTARVNVIILMPAFPRPKTDWKIYTHALDRDSMLTDKKEYRRFDLQLAAMIDDAREKLKAEKLETDKRVLIFGFSASAMFANRFTFLHPKRVKAAVIVSPGGWAIAPAAAYNGKTLRYPIGAGDFRAVSGADLDIKNLRKVPLFISLGDRDDNDSVIFRDSYEKEDEDLIFALFGKTPVERWDDSKKLYQDNKLNAEFRLYPNVKHGITEEMFADIFAFLKKYAG
jgi:dienelactone hydrolase